MWYTFRTGTPAASAQAEAHAKQAVSLNVWMMGPSQSEAFRFKIQPLQKTATFMALWVAAPCPLMPVDDRPTLNTPLAKVWTDLSKKTQKVLLPLDIDFIEDLISKSTGVGSCKIKNRIMGGGRTAAAAPASWS